MRMQLHELTALRVIPDMQWFEELFTDVPYRKSQLVYRASRIHVTDVFNNGELSQIAVEWWNQPTFYTFTDIGFPLIQSERRLSHGEILTAIKNTYNLPLSQLARIDGRTMRPKYLIEHDQAELNEHIKDHQELLSDPRYAAKIENARAAAIYPKQLFLFKTM